MMSLPDSVYCRFDPSCIGVECCITVKLYVVSLAFKVYARIDPCKLKFVAGVNSKNYTVEFKKGVEWGK